MQLSKYPPLFISTLVNVNYLAIIVIVKWTISTELVSLLSLKKISQKNVKKGSVHFEFFCKCITYADMLKLSIAPFF